MNPTLVGCGGPTKPWATEGVEILAVNRSTTAAVMLHAVTLIPVKSCQNSVERLNRSNSGLHSRSLKLAMYKRKVEVLTTMRNIAKTTVASCIVSYNTWLFRLLVCFLSWCIFPRLASAPPSQERATGVADASEPLCVAQGAAANVSKISRRHLRNTIDSRARVSPPVPSHRHACSRFASGLDSQTYTARIAQSQRCLQYDHPRDYLSPCGPLCLSTACYNHFGP